MANALIHRSYVKKAPVRVFVFDDRVEIHSPGLLPDGMDVESLKKGTSRPVNELLFNHAIHLLPYTGVGTGIMRALNLESDMKMVNDEALQEFVVTFARVAKDAVSVEDNVGDGEDNAQKINDVESLSKNSDVEDSVRVERIPYKDLPPQWKDVVKYCSIPRSAREIISHLKYSYNSKYVSEILHPLMDMGYLEMLFPDKPNSKNQKYRKVEKR